MELKNHLHIPSPVSEINTSWNKDHNVRIQLKRDDLIHPLISGNKWRKLSGIFSKFNAEHFDKIVTYGGAYSNHLVATAVVCAIQKIPCKGIVRGEEPKERNALLQLCRLYGMQIEFISRAKYKKTNRLYGVFDRELFIPEGGACHEGTLGCTHILSETNLSNVDQIYVSCGTGTTIAGMHSYLQAQNLKIPLIGIQVLKGSKYIEAELLHRFNIGNCIIYDQFHEGGYAKTNAQLIDFIHDFTVETGVLLDPIYTGKMMFAIKQLIEQNAIESGKKILAIHTGGMTGWLGKGEELNYLKKTPHNIKDV